MSLNHLTAWGVPDSEALNLKVNKLYVVDSIDQPNDSLSYVGGLDTETTLPFSTDNLPGAVVINPAKSTMCLQTAKSFQVGYSVIVRTPANTTSNTIDIICPYPEALRTNLIPRWPNVLDEFKMSAIGYTFTIDNITHNNASLVVASFPTTSYDANYIKFVFRTNDGLPFTSNETVVFKIQHTQG
jgi:hypothetical protein